MFWTAVEERLWGFGLEGTFFTFGPRADLAHIQLVLAALVYQSAVSRYRAHVQFIVFLSRYQTGDELLVRKWGVKFE